MNEGSKVIRREARKLIERGKEMLRMADYLDALNVSGKRKRTYRRRRKAKKTT